MSTSWRITTKEQNLSSVAIPSVGNIGATVIRSSKGPLKPVFIPKGGEQKILNVFGRPSATYPDVWDAIEYSKKASLWISAPYKSGYFGGVLVTKTGTVALTSGQSSITNIDFTAIPIYESLGTGDGSTTAFSITLSDATYYNNTTVDIQVDGVSINVTASDLATEVLTTSPDVGSGTYVRSTGVLTFTFDTAPTNGQVITAHYTTNRSSDAYFAMFTKGPQTDDLATKITNVSSVFKINLYLKDTSGNYNAIPESPVSASLTEGTKDGFGKNIYIVDAFEDSDYVNVVLNEDLAFTTFVDDSANVLFAGGSRGSTITITELTTGWNYFQSANTYKADIFFDCTADSGIPALFETLRGTYQKYSAYILPLPNASYTSAKATKAGYSVSNRGIYFYWNWGKVRDTYNNSFLYSPLIGRVAGKHADMVDIFNGLAPSWIDENNHGGQLGSGIIEMVYDPSESELQDADENQINPIIFDPNYGVMIVSQRTSYTTLSDYSYIGHSRVADYVISNVVNQVLPYQLTKLNDVIHRSIVRSKAESIVNPLLAAPNNLISEALIKCDEENNNAQVLARREFVLQVAVKFTPFSETITFTFINVAQTTSVTEVI